MVIRNKNRREVTTENALYVKDQMKETRKNFAKTGIAIL